MAKAKVKTRNELLQMEAEVAVLADQLDTLKAQRPRCSSCGRLEVVVGKSDLEDQIRELGVTVHEQRKEWRTERAKAREAAIAEAEAKADKR